MHPDNEAAVNKLVESGRFRDREEAIDAIVSHVRDEDARKLDRLRRKLRSAIEQDDRGDVLALDGDDELQAFFEGLKLETRTKTAAP